MEDIALLSASYTDSSLRNFRREIPKPIELIDVRNEPNVDIEKYDAAIITGSKSSVLDDEDWINNTENLVQLAVSEHKLPILGVCWGSQLLAQALGGTVESRSQRELGYRRVRRTDIDHPIFRGISDSFTSFESHGDYVTEIPDDADLLAENQQAIQAFSYKSAVGIQFHPEVDYTTARNLVREYKDQKTTPNPSCSLKDYAKSEESSDVLRNFIYDCVHTQ